MGCAVTAGGVAYSHRPRTAPPVVEDAMPAEVRAALAERVVGILEGGGALFFAPAAEERTRSACAVRVLGADPRGLTDASTATAAYVVAACGSPSAYGGAGSGQLAPLAVRLTPTVSVQVPEDGRGYSDSIRAMMPERLLGAALDHQRHAEQLQAEVTRRATRRG